MPPTRPTYEWLTDTYPTGPVSWSICLSVRHTDRDVWSTRLSIGRLVGSFSPLHFSRSNFSHSNSRLTLFSTTLNISISVIVPAGSVHSIEYLRVPGPWTSCSALEDDTCYTHSTQLHCHAVIVATALGYRTAGLHIFIKAKIQHAR